MHTTPINHPKNNIIICTCAKKALSLQRLSEKKVSGPDILERFLIAKKNRRLVSEVQKKIVYLIKKGYKDEKDYLYSRSCLVFDDR